MSVFLLISHYCKSYPTLGFAKLNGKVFPFLQFSSRSLACFTELFRLFYTVNSVGKLVKGVPHNIYDILTLQGLAHLISGDGSKANGDGLILNTQSFSIEDNVRLINVLMIKFNCICSIHYQRGLPVIYISANSMRDLRPLLVPHMVVEMLYKLPKPR